MKSSQSGFSLLLIIAIIAVVGVGGTVTYVGIKSAQDKKAASVAAEQKAKAAADAKNVKADDSQKIAESTTTPATNTPAPAPAPVTQAAPTQTAPAPKPAPTSNATAFTWDNCNYHAGNTVAYVSNRNGAAVSSNYPNNWVTVKTYPYGATVSGQCDTWNYEYPGYVKLGDTFIKMADISPTQP